MTWGSMDIVVSKITPIYLVCERGLIMSVPKRSAGVKTVLDYTLKYTALELARL